MWLGFHTLEKPGRHEARPNLFRFFAAGMSHEVDEGVGPGWIIVGYPVADDIEIVLSL